MSVINVNVHFFFPKIKLIKLNHDVKFIFYRTLLGNRGDRELIVILMKLTTIRTTFYGDRFEEINQYEFRFHMLNREVDDT